MKKEIKFKLLHLMLYAKGWYKKESHGNTIWDDLKIILSMDGYQGDIMTKNDIVQVITISCQELSKLNISHFELRQVLNGIRVENCWKYYPVKEHKDTWFEGREDLPDYDYDEAVIKYFISGLRYLSIPDTVGKLPTPDYSKGLLMSSTTNIGRVVQMFCRREKELEV